MERKVCGREGQEFGSTWMLHEKWHSARTHNRLFFSNVSSSHRNESAPGAFSQAVGRLTTCVGSDDSGIVTVDPLEGLTADEFGVEIGIEFLGNSICISTKGFEGRDDVVGGE